MALVWHMAFVPWHIIVFEGNVNIRNRNLIITFVAIGFLGTEFKASLAPSITSWPGILVYKGFTSKVTKNVFLLYFLLHCFY